MTIIIFLAVLSVLVLVHEAGHYFAARLFGVSVDEFGFGFPPRLVGYVREKTGWKRVASREQDVSGKTIWSINWLPLGGFVRLKGEAADGTGAHDSFHTKPVWQRLIILAAGVVMNWVLAVIFFSIVFSIGSRTAFFELPDGASVRDIETIVTQIAVDSPASIAGIPAGATIMTIDDVTPTSSAHAQSLIAEQEGQPFSFVVATDAGEQTFQVQAEYLEAYDKTAIGIALADVGVVSYPPLRAVVVSVETVWSYSKTIVMTLGDLVRSLVTRKPVADELAGPVGIAVITGRVAEQGILPLLEFMAILSINLAVLNILPIPALDGGRVLFLVIEKIRRKPMSRNVEAVIHNIAFFILIGLILIITAVDIGRLSSSAF